MEIKKIKNAIVGKLWLNDDEGDENQIQPASLTITEPMVLHANAENEKFNIGKNQKKVFRTDRNLLRDVKLGVGDTLHFYPNKQRSGINPQTGEDFKDADYSVSIVLPEKDALEFIEHSKKMAKEYKYQQERKQS